jgi:lysophospholipase L1-like esterase
MSARRALEILFLLVVPLALFLLLSEGFLRIYLRSHIFYDVEMSRYARLLKLDSPNPLIGHHHVPAAQATLMGVSVRINSDGFRDDEYGVERGDKRRIMFLGDSLTFGWGVEKEQTFEHLLEGDLDAQAPTEVINLGIGNYNTTQEFNLFIEKGLKYRPDEVVLFYFINDAEPMPRKARFPGLGNYRIVTFYWSRIKALRSRFAETPGFKEFYSALYADEADGWAKSKAAFLQLRDASVKQGFDLKVVLLPELHQLDPYTFSREHRLIVDFLQSNDIATLDLAPHFRGVKDPQGLWVAMDDAHPNARAHRLIADYTLDFLTENAP